MAVFPGNHDVNLSLFRKEKSMLVLCSNKEDAKWD